MLVYSHCGVGLVVECVLAKDETGVRFSYAAQSVSKTNILFGVSKQTALLAWRIEGRSYVFLARKTSERRPARFASDGEQNIRDRGLSPSIPII